MEPKYRKGQTVIIAPVKDERLCQKEYRLEPYAGKIGRVADYYWIDIGQDVPPVRYIYTVRIEDDDKEVVVHEDEIRDIDSRIRKVPRLRKT